MAMTVGRSSTRARGGDLTLADIAGPGWKRSDGGEPIDQRVAASV